MAKEFDERKVRFQGADWFTAGPQEIVIGGAGGIGSWVAMFLGRIGHELHIFDNDTIDTSNMAGQLYSTKQIGVNKAEATANNVQEFCGITPEIYGLYDENSVTSPIVFSCFDNMKARKLMFEKWAEQEDREVFVDGRMLAEVGMVYIVQKGQEDMYRATLFSDDEIQEAPCSYKATSHCGAFIATLMVSNFNNYLTNKVLGDEFRIVQFQTDFELPLLTVTEAKVEVEEELEV